MASPACVICVCLNCSLNGIVGVGPEHFCAISDRYFVDPLPEILGVVFGSSVLICSLLQSK